MCVCVRATQHGGLGYHFMRAFQRRQRATINNSTKHILKKLHKQQTWNEMCVCAFVSLVRCTTTTSSHRSYIGTWSKMLNYRKWKTPKNEITKKSEIQPVQTACVLMRYFKFTFYQPKTYTHTLRSAGMLTREYCAVQTRSGRRGDLFFKFCFLLRLNLNCDCEPKCWYFDRILGAGQFQCSSKMFSSSASVIGFTEVMITYFAFTAKPEKNIMRAHRPRWHPKVNAHCWTVERSHLPE